MNLDVRDAREASRFEADVEGKLAIADYTRRDGEIVFTHTEVPPPLRGKGVASALIRGALDQVRGEGVRVVPSCPFVKAYIERHPEFEDLLAA